MSVKIKFSKFIYEDGMIPVKEIIRNGVAVGYIKKKTSWNESVYIVTTTDWTGISSFQELKEAQSFAKVCFQSESTLFVALTESFRKRIVSILNETFFI